MVSEAKDKLIPQPNLMSAYTKQRLIEDLARAEAELAEAKRQIGEAAGGSHDWHDNFAYEQATRDAQLNMTRVLNLRAALTNVAIIAPRERVDTIGIGNNVMVSFENQDGEEFSLLGPQDVNYQPHAISFYSPLGAQLLGKTTGDSVKFKVKERELTVKVIEVRPGAFRNAQ